MRFKNCIGLLFILAGFNLFGQQDPLLSRIILIGDAGEMVDGRIATVEKAKTLFDINDRKNIVIYLGDNVYEYGLPDITASNFDEKRKILDEQVSLVKGTAARAYFIPGNHDWKKGKAGGWQQLKNQQQYLESLQLPNVEMMPKNGCPGPVELVLNSKVVLVFMDSQWWLEQLDKPGVESDCDCHTGEEVATALKEIAAVHSDKLMIVAMHHPFYTHGPHGGYFTIKQHIFPFTEMSPGLYIPLPVIGSIYPITRGLFGTPQDVNHPGYRNLVNQIEEVLKTHPDVIHIAGHEHALEFLQKDNISYIVSGSGSKTTRVKKGSYSEFAKKENGFAVLEVTESGKVSVKFYGVDENEPLFTKALEPVPSKKEADILADIKIVHFPDSASSIGSDKFEAGGMRKMLIGRNYRKEWGETVKAPVLNIGNEMGGLKILRRGGGHQTKSLRLEDSKGNEWVLRSVEKTVTDAALPPDLRGTFVKDLVQDGVSASYPYAALSVPVLADAADVNHATPKLVYVPDDPRLGKYRLDFANTLCLLEEREPGGFKKTINTVELAEKLKDDNDNQVDQPELLKARLLDMFIMDFDRHEDQWRWGIVDEKKGNLYVPIPRDRDQAFFINQGFFPWVASQPWVTPQVQGFRSKARNIKYYNFNARNIDRTYLNEMDEEDWKKATDKILASMTDEVIEKALSRQPDEVKKYSYGSIINKLKERRKYYGNEMMSYYRFISKIVNIAGSDKNELFDVNREADGFVTVTVHKITKEGNVSTKMYERRFDPSVTKELRLYGLGNDDQFKIHGPGDKIRIRIIGGKGEDAYENTSGGGRTIVYDRVDKDNAYSGKFSLHLSDKPEVTNYNSMDYLYNLWIPFFSVSYNRDDGIYVGASIKHIARGFRKEPYARSHQLVINHSLATKAYNFRFYNEFIKAVGPMDLLVNADIKAPNNVTNFFGYGNETKNFIDSKPGRIEYYRTRYTLGDLSMLLRKKGKSVSFSFGPTYEFFSLDTISNAGRIIDNPAESGLNKKSISENKSWLGGIFTLGFDTRNNQALPTRGINWQTTLRVLSGMNGGNSTVSQLNSDMSIYMSFSRDPKLVFATRFGYGVNLNNNYEFFQAQYLGGTINMRGLRKYRFAGKSVTYNNTDLRIKIADFRTYLFPGSLGILLFHDVGRVWVSNDNSSKWHTGYGGGIWISPMRRAVIALSIARSDEETLPVVNFGFQF